jgi:hypothetical protein
MSQKVADFMLTRLKEWVSSASIIPAMASTALWGR